MTDSGSDSRDGGDDGNAADAGNAAGAADADETSDAEWPVSFSGVIESVVTTLGPNDRWNAAALGLFAGDPVTARTWGNTRTRRNFRRRGECYVQFTRDPVDFVESALSIYEVEEPVLESADAWARVEVDRVGAGRENGTRWETWELRPIDSEVRNETVPTVSRAFGAVVEGTVAASRLGVEGYDDEKLRSRLERCESIVDRTGGPREREAFDRLRERSNRGPRNRDADG